MCKESERKELHVFRVSTSQGYHLYLRDHRLQKNLIARCRSILSTVFKAHKTDAASFRVVVSNNLVQGCQLPRILILQLIQSFFCLRIQFYGECWSGATAPKTYDRYGRSSPCTSKSVVGTALTNVVYRFAGDGSQNNRFIVLFVCQFVCLWLVGPLITSPIIMCYRNLIRVVDVHALLALKVRTLH